MADEVCAPPRIGWIPRDEVTIDRLHGVFMDSFFHVRRSGECGGYLSVRFENVEVAVLLLPDNTLVSFQTRIRLKVKAPAPDKMEFVNLMNRDVRMLPRFEIPQNPFTASWMKASYDLYYEGGLAARHLVVCLRMFGASVLLAVELARQAGLRDPGWFHV